MKISKAWQEAADRFHEQRLAYAKKQRPLIVKWKWVPNRSQVYSLHQKIGSYPIPQEGIGMTERVTLWMEGEPKWGKRTLLT